MPGCGSRSGSGRGYLDLFPGPDLVGVQVVVGSAFVVPGRGMLIGMGGTSWGSMILRCLSSLVGSRCLGASRAAF